MKSAPHPTPSRVPPGVVARIAAHAAERPRAAAVVDADRVLDYAGFASAASALARRLRAAGARPGEPVAVHLERSADCVVAAAAAMAAGAAYLMLDVRQPAERTREILRSSGARFVLTDPGRWKETGAGGVTALDATMPEALSGTAPEAPGDTSTPSAPAGAAGPGAPEPPGGALPLLVGEDSEDREAGEVGDGGLAYVNYTSGSTGRPKGVLVAHAGLANLVDWHLARHGTGPGDRLTQLARPSFDAFALEVWPCLAAGATLHIVDQDLLASPERLRDWLCRTGITVSFVPTGLAEPLLALPWPDGCALRHLLTGGDRLTARPPAGLPFRVHNNYGPTECTVVATCHEVEPGGPAHEPPPIGTPLPGVTAYVLDGAGAPVRPGEPGQLHIGGAGVARGYLDAPEEAGRFAPDPFAAAPGARMYATGDLVRQDAAGLLHFLGRDDDQVQIRGYRVEPAEVERAVLRHPHAARAAVVARDTDPPQLVAYVTGGSADPDPQELRRFLADALPEWMVPAAVVPVASLPVTADGKTDRAALAARPLPLPTRAEEQPQGEPQGPGEPFEAELAGLWREVLDQRDIAPGDDFFDLGGDSLRVIRLVGRARRRGLELSQEDVYEHPVLRDLSRALARRRDGGDDGTPGPDR